MQRAYRFEKGPVNWDNLGAATVVNIRAYQKKDGGHLRCTYHGCFQEVSARRKAGSDELECFFHHGDLGAPYCPYRSEYEFKPRVVAMDVALSQLAHKLPGDKIRFDVGDLEFDLRGLAKPATFRYLDPDKTTELAQLAETDPRQVLFVATLKDLRRIGKDTLDTFTKRRPVLILEPSERDDRPHRTAIAADRITWSDLEPNVEDLDLLLVDWEELFEFDHDECVFFTPTPEKLAVESLQAALDRKDTRSESWRVLRLLAKRLLVDGASVHQAVFEQELEPARDFHQVGPKFPHPDQIVTMDEFLDLPEDTQACTLLKNATLASCYDQLRDRTRQIATARSTNQDQQLRHLEAAVTDKDSLIESLQGDNAALESRVSDNDQRVTTLQSEVERLSTQLGDAQSKLDKRPAILGWLAESNSKVELRAARRFLARLAGIALLVAAVLVLVIGVGALVRFGLRALDSRGDDVVQAKTQEAAEVVPATVPKSDFQQPTPAPPSAAPRDTQPLPSTAEPPPAPEEDDSTQPPQDGESTESTAETVPADEKPSLEEPGLSAPQPESLPAPTEPPAVTRTPPRLVSHPPPRFPPMARKLGKTAQVKLRLQIGIDGRVLQATTVGPEAGFGFEREARRTALAARYAPATENGQPVPAETELVVKFGTG